MWESAILNKYYDAIYEGHNPFKFSEIAEEGYATVVNDGEAPVGWTIDFLALDEVVNPSIYNMVTEEKVQIYKTLVQGEQLSISTEGDELTVTSIAPNGKKTDAFKYLDIESISEIKYWLQ